MEQTFYTKFKRCYVKKTSHRSEELATFLTVKGSAKFLNMETSANFLIWRDYTERRDRERGFTDCEVSGTKKICSLG